MENYLYHYTARIVSVYDGDTVRADIDLGLSAWIHNEKLRLSRINAPELRGAEKDAGLKARDFLVEHVADKDIVIATQKDRKGKYGRYLVEIWVQGPDGVYFNMNDLMVTSGHAHYQEY